MVISARNRENIINQTFLAASQGFSEEKVVNLELDRDNVNVDCHFIAKLRFGFWGDKKKCGRWVGGIGIPATNKICRSQL